jgi:hypothetical protein
MSDQVSTDIIFASAITGEDFHESGVNPKAEQLMGLVFANDLERAADDLFDFASKAVRHRYIFELNALVEALEAYVGVSLDFSTAVLTATLPLKKRLVARSRFVDALRRELASAGKDATRELQGLL